MDKIQQTERRPDATPEIEAFANMYKRLTGDFPKPGSLMNDVLVGIVKPVLELEDDREILLWLIDSNHALEELTSGGWSAMVFDAEGVLEAECVSDDWRHAVREVMDATDY